MKRLLFFLLLSILSSCCVKCPPRCNCEPPQKEYTTTSIVVDSIISPKTICNTAGEFPVSIIVTNQTPDSISLDCYLSSTLSAKNEWDVNSFSMKTFQLEGYGSGIFPMTVKNNSGVKISSDYLIKAQIFKNDQPLSYEKFKFVSLVQCHDSIKKECELTDIHQKNTFLNNEGILSKDKVGVKIFSRISLQYCRIKIVAEIEDIRKEVVFDVGDYELDQMLYFRFERDLKSKETVKFTLFINDEQIDQKVYPPTVK